MMNHGFHHSFNYKGLGPKLEKIGIHYIAKSFKTIICTDQSFLTHISYETHLHSCYEIVHPATGDEMCGPYNLQSNAIMLC